MFQYVDMNEVKSAAHSPQGAIMLVTKDLTGCQVTILIASHENSRAALLAHVSPAHHALNSEERYEIDGKDWVDSMQESLEDNPILKNPDEIIIYHDSRNPAPLHPEENALSEKLDIDISNAKLTKFPYEASGKKTKSVKVTIPASRSSITCEMNQGKETIHFHSCSR